MTRPKIAIIGAGSRSFGPATIRDIFLSKHLRHLGVRLVLMDTIQKHVSEVARATASGRCSPERSASPYQRLKIAMGFSGGII